MNYWYSPAANCVQSNHIHMYTKYVCYCYCVCLLNFLIFQIKLFSFHSCLNSQLFIWFLSIFAVYVSHTHLCVFILCERFLAIWKLRIVFEFKQLQCKNNQYFSLNRIWFGNLLLSKYCGFLYDIYSLCFTLKQTHNVSAHQS